MLDSDAMSHDTREPLRHDWTIGEIEAIYSQPLSNLIFDAQRAHRAWHASDEVQGCVLLSIKTGGCPEDCAYCPQSAHYDTGVIARRLWAITAVFRAAARLDRHQRR